MTLWPMYVSLDAVKINPSPRGCVLLLCLFPQCVFMFVKIICILEVVLPCILIHSVQFLCSAVEYRGLFRVRTSMEYWIGVVGVMTFPAVLASHLGHLEWMNGQLFCLHYLLVSQYSYDHQNYRLVCTNINQCRSILSIDPSKLWESKNGKQ